MNRITEAYEVQPDLDERLAARTEKQIQDGHLDNGDLDPRGYCVTCPRCFQQWWGTPDNLPITHADCDREGCTCKGAVE